jgi:hypothetical protein
LEKDGHLPSDGAIDRVLSVKESVISLCITYSDKILTSFNFIFSEQNRCFEPISAWVMILFFRVERPKEKKSCSLVVIISLLLIIKAANPFNNMNNIMINTLTIAIYKYKPKKSACQEKNQFIFYL